MGEVQEAILEALRERGPMHHYGLRQATGKHPANVTNAIRALLLRGEIEECLPPADYVKQGPRATFYRLKGK